MNSSIDRLFDLKGRVAVVTGGAGLLGQEFVETLATAGAGVVVADIDRLAGERVCYEIRSKYSYDVRSMVVDVTDPTSVEQVVRQIVSTFGTLDILVNNAAINPKVESSGLCSEFERYPIEAWNATLAVNLTGSFLCAQEVGNQMLRQGGGVIINIASTYGLVGPDQRIYKRGGTDNETMCKPVDYSVSKAAVIMLTRYLAAYWAGKNIRVNTLTPGGVDAGVGESFRKDYAYRTTLGRMAKTSDYRGALLFLASDASAYMSGANLVVDGGWTAW